jgi:hypothetical protein
MRMRIGRRLPDEGVPFARRDLRSERRGDRVGDIVLG